MENQFGENTQDIKKQLNESDGREALMTEAVAIYENRHHLTDAQLARLDADKELRDQVQSLIDIETVTMRNNDISDEEIERRFAQLNKGKRAQLKRILYPTVITAIAAALIGFIFLVKGTDEGKKLMADGMVIPKVDAVGVSMTGNDGAVIIDKKSNDRHSVISTADYRKAITESKVTESVVLNVPYGHTSDVVLPDGSMVCMRPGSAIKFPVNFTGDKRVVLFSGQGYFKVKRDEEHPFVVLTETSETTVLGTEFDVNTNNSQCTTVTLISGSVNVKKRDSDKSMTIVPGQQATITATDMNLATVDVRPYQYWAEGFLYYNNVEIGTIVRELAHIYGMEVEFADDAPVDLPARFITERDKDIDNTIETINMLKKVFVCREGNKLKVEKY